MTTSRQRTHRARSGSPSGGGPRVIVVGAGIIGLSCAWGLLRAGCDVTVVDPDPASGATRAAAGMIAPASEAVFGQEALLAAGLASRGLWPGFAARLSEDSGHDVGLHRSGTLVVAADLDDEAVLGRHARLLERHRCRVERLPSRTARRLEPALSPRLAGALLLDDEASVDPRQVAQALLAAFERRGGHLVRSRAELWREGTGVLVEDGARLLAADLVVAACGWQTLGLVSPVGVDVPVRPLKGQILRLRACPPEVLHRTVRAAVHGREVYLVPRPSGEVVVGATSEDVGADTTVTAGGVHDLLHDAIEVVPELSEAVLVESMARLRPATADNLPVVGRTTVPGLVVATGHGRDGVLLAPLTADAVVAHVLGGHPPHAASSFAAQRPSLAKEYA